MSTKTYLTVEEREVLGVTYRLDRVVEYEDCFIITVFDESDFFCGSIACDLACVHRLLQMLADHLEVSYATQRNGGWSTMQYPQSK